MMKLYEIKKTYKKLKNVPAMLYEPVEPDPKTKVAIIIMHSDGDYIDTPQAYALAQRGYRCFAAHVADKKESLDNKLMDLHKVVKYAKEYPGVEKVLLLGHSGGATLMSAYEAIAEMGQAYFQSGRHLIDLDKIEDPIPCDGVILIDSNFGNGVMTLLSLDPAIINEGDGIHLDPAYDLFNVSNGYDPDGNCHYSDEFISSYVHAQGKRMNRLIDYCQDRIRLIEEGKGAFLDDEPLVIAGGEQTAFCNKIFPQLTKYFSHTRQAYELIHCDDSISKQIIQCVRPARSFNSNRPIIRTYH